MPLDESEQRQVRKYEARMAPALAEVRKWQVAINAVYEAADEPPPYSISGEVSGLEPSAQRKRYGRAEFFTMALATVVQKLIEDSAEKALNIDEIYELMVSGGFPFKEPNAERAKENLKISLGKNVKFARTATGFYTIASGSPRRRGATRDTGSGSQNGPQGDPVEATGEDSPGLDAPAEAEKESD